MTAPLHGPNAVVEGVEIQDMGAVVTVAGRDGRRASRFYPYMALHHLLFPHGMLLDRLPGTPCVFDFDGNELLRLVPAREETP